MLYERLDLREVASGLRVLAGRAACFEKASDLRTATVSVLGYGVESLDHTVMLRSPSLPQSCVTTLGNIVGGMRCADAGKFLFRLSDLLEHLAGVDWSTLAEYENLIDIAHVRVALSQIKSCAGSDPWMPQFESHINMTVDSWLLLGGLQAWRSHHEAVGMRLALDEYAAVMKEDGDAIGQVHAMAAWHILQGNWSRFVATLTLRDVIAKSINLGRPMAREVRLAGLQQAHVSRREAFNSGSGALFLSLALGRLGVTHGEQLA